MAILALISTHALERYHASARLRYCIRDDEPWIDALSKHHTVFAVDWHDQSFDWRGVDRALIRTPWDYQAHEPAFLQCLQRIEQAGVPLDNPLELVRWNLDKSYLWDLSARGVTILPARPLSPTPGGLRDQLEQEGWDEVVIKPLVSACGDDTHRLNRASVDRLPELLELAGGPSRPFMVQPFRPQILDEGEWSLHFFDGLYSHTVIKRPCEGEFRIHEERGGATQLGVQPPQALVDQARQVLGALSYAPLYARVDGVLEQGRFELMELELVEPELYFRGDERALDRFVQALLRRLAPD